VSIAYVQSPVVEYSGVKKNVEVIFINVLKIIKYINKDLDLIY